MSVTVSGRGVFTAELERFDVRTGAALLSVGAEGLALAPGERRTVAPGEPVLLLSRDEDGGELVVKETYASPSLNAPDHLVALHGDYTPFLQLGHRGGGRRWHTRRSCKPHADILRPVDRSWRALGARPRNTVGEYLGV